MAAPRKPPSKYAEAQKYAVGVAIVFAAAVLGWMMRTDRSKDDRTDDCKEQVAYLRGELAAERAARRAADSTNTVLQRALDLLPSAVVQTPPKP